MSLPDPIIETLPYKPNSTYSGLTELQSCAVSEPLTKRERFAMAAMQGFCANSDYAGMKYEALASMARKQADAAIAELEANPEPK